MNRWVAAAILLLVASTVAFSQGPEVRLVDDKLSVDAEAISLGWLLQLVDLATGMKSSVSPEWADRKITVKFSDLDVNDGLRKILQNLPLNYVVIEGKRVVVTSVVPAGIPSVEEPKPEDAKIEPNQDGLQELIVQTPNGSFLSSRSAQSQDERNADREDPRIGSRASSIEEPISTPPMAAQPRFPDQSSNPSPSHSTIGQPVQVPQRFPKQETNPFPPAPASSSGIPARK